MRDRVTIGSVVKPHGLHGEVVVYPLTDVPDRFAAGASLRVGHHDRIVVASRPHQGRVLVRFDGVTDRTAAEALRGLDISAELIDDPDRETYFVHELVGLPVRTADDEELGTVTAAIELPAAAAYDLLEVTRSDGSTWLLPAADALVAVEDGVCLRVIELPDGLTALRTAAEPMSPAEPEPPTESP